MAQFISEGVMINYVPSGNVAVGAVVVQGTLVGVATRAIPANELGALHVAGLFEFDKATTSASAIAAGVAVYWDANNEIATTSSGGNTLMGKAAAAAAATDSKVRVILG